MQFPLSFTIFHFRTTAATRDLLKQRKDKYNYIILAQP